MGPPADAVLCVLLVIWTFRDHLSISTLVPSKGHSFGGGYCFGVLLSLPRLELQHNP
jgi:hypothetical protein